MLSKIKTSYILIAIILIGTLLRLWNLTSISLWHDEAFSALLLRYPWAEMMHRIGLDVHPPLYYIILRFWAALFDESLASLRGFSLLFGVATIPMVYALVKKISANQTAALLSAAFVAINPFQIYYVTEARMYTFGTFLVLLLAYLTAVWMENIFTDTRIARMTQIGFVLTGSALLYTHYYLVFSLIAAGILLLGTYLYHYRLNIKKYWSLVWPVFTIGVLYIPWLPTFQYQLNQVSAGYWIPPITFWNVMSVFGQFVTGTDLMYGFEDWKNKLVAILVLTILMTGLLIWKYRSKALLVTVFLIAPFAGSLLFVILAHLKGSTTSVFLVRYFVFTSPFFLITLAWWIAQAQSKFIKALITVSFLVATYYGMNIFLDNNNPETYPGMRAASEVINREAIPGDSIVIATSTELFNFTYYNHTGIHPLIYTPTVSEAHVLPHWAGTALLNDSDLLSDWKNLSVSKDNNLWLIWTNAFGSGKPELPQGFTEVSEQKFDDARPYTGTSIYVTKLITNN